METRDLINKMIQTEGRIQHCPFCHGTITNIASEQITHTADCVWYEIRVKLDEIVAPVVPYSDKEFMKKLTGTAIKKECGDHFIGVDMGDKLGDYTAVTRANNCVELI